MGKIARSKLIRAITAALETGTAICMRGAMAYRAIHMTEISLGTIVLRGAGNRQTRTKMRWILAAAIAISSMLMVPDSSCGKTKMLCSEGEGQARKKVAGFQLVITPLPDERIPSESECQAEVIDPKNNVIFDVNDTSFSIAFTGRDVNGAPHLVLESYSGGAHCCWTYYIISLGSKPGMLLKLENNRDVSFYKNKNGRIDLATLDGAFDYFDEVCHACSPFPLVYLRLDGSNLIDISPEYIQEYDEIIRDSQRGLTAEQRQRLKTLKEKPSDDEPVERARYHALTIVLAYLYSGREKQAHQALQELWPPFDQERIWNSILETRRNGILCYTRKGAVCGLDVADQ